MIEFFYDCSSPWTYLGFESIQRLATEEGVAIRWRPILVGGVFNAINPAIYEQRANPVPAKQVYLSKDLADWARLLGLQINFPPSLFPVNSAKAMRACIVADRYGKIVPLSRRIFQAYWSEDRDIASDEVLAAVATDVGLDARELMAKASSPELKAALRANTDELMARGGFGSPTTFVGTTDMFFGNDRMPVIRAAIQSQQGRRP